MVITFDLPEEACRRQILKQYAQQLSEDEVQQLGRVTEGLSCRDLRDVCEQCERRWASKLIREEVKEPVPPLQEYLSAARQRFLENRG